MEVARLLKIHPSYYVSVIMKDVNLKAFNWINDSKTIGKHIFCGYTCEFGGRKCNSKPKWNNDKCQFECKTQYT